VEKLIFVLSTTPGLDTLQPTGKACWPHGTTCWPANGFTGS